MAVLAVVAYHLGLGWAPGGLLGVGVFFTLSGYLITDLLLGQRAGRPLQLVDFWLRRARRLLPALFVMLAVVVGWVALLGPGPAAGAARDGRGGRAVREQLVADRPAHLLLRPLRPAVAARPPVVAGRGGAVLPGLAVAAAARPGAASRRAAARVGAYRRLAAATLLLAAASASAMALLYHPGFDPTRVYDGTDTRAFALLIGAALAFVWPSRRLRAATSRRRAAGAWTVAGVVGLVVIGVLIWRPGEYSPFLYRGGLVLLSVATALVVAAVRRPASRLGRVLGVAAAALDRRPLLRHLPVALPDHRADHARPTATDDPVRGALQVARDASPSPRCPGASSRSRSGTAPLGRWPGPQLRAGGWRGRRPRRWAGPRAAVASASAAPSPAPGWPARCRPCAGAGEPVGQPAPSSRPGSPADRPSHRPAAGRS